MSCTSFYDSLSIAQHFFSTLSFDEKEGFIYGYCDEMGVHTDISALDNDFFLWLFSYLERLGLLDL